MATIREVARRAQVSVGTVSKVLTNTPYVGEKSRERVLHAIEELGYVPNLAGRALSKGRTYNLGILFPYHHDWLFGDPYQLSILEGIEEVCFQEEYNMLVSTLRTPLTDSPRFQRMVRGGYMDGAISLELMPEAHVGVALDKTGLTRVTIGYYPTLRPENSIYVDAALGAKALAAYVIGMGHRRISMVTVAKDAFNSWALRMGGYKAAFDEAGLDFDAVSTFVGNFSIESGYEAGQALLSLPTKPTAILCFNDRMAIGVIQRLHLMGLRVPEDVSVTGFDDITSAAFCWPPLTTVRQPGREVGAVAARMVLDLIKMKSARTDDPPPPTTPTLPQVILPSELVIRDSVAAL